MHGFMGWSFQPSSGAAHRKSRPMTGRNRPFFMVAKWRLSHWHWNWGADLVLMDETEGRLAAAALHLRTMGLLGILIQARQRSLIPAISPLLDCLQAKARFWISPALRRAVLLAAGETLSSS
jgi:Domain of unknown function (DUF3368)